MIALVGAKMLGEVVDPLGQQGNLHLGRPCVALVMAEFGNDLLGGLHNALNTCELWGTGEIVAAEWSFRSRGAPRRLDVFPYLHTQRVDPVEFLLGSDTSYEVDRQLLTV